jgi:hypothetical protein
MFPVDSKSVAWVNFEDDVFSHVEKWLKSGRLSVNSIRATAYRKRSYYSEPRKAKIKFEVAIEAFDDGASEPSLVWVWECKDHSSSGRKVEVADIEVLNDKIDQLGRSRFKGSLVTTHGFQTGATQRAKACGISLFVLRNELHRVLKYSRDAPPEIWVERLVVSTGVTLAGHDCSPGDWFDDTLSRCLNEFRTGQVL